MDKQSADSSDLTEKENYLYSVLNLSKDASQAEINERYRSLSLIFHPDKQRDEGLKGVSSKEFLEIQKAYQVLSDPFLRQVYDTLGSKGLAIKWPPYIRSRSKEEIQKLIEQNEVVLQRRTMNEYILSKAKVVCQLDASSLFDLEDEPDTSVATRVRERFANFHSISRHMTYSIEKKLNQKTSVSFASEALGQRNRSVFRFIGTIRHQFSPRIVAATSFNPLYPFTTKIEAKYEDTDNTLSLNTGFLLVNPASLPATTISFSRRLFRSSPQRGSITLHASKRPSISFQYSSPPTIKVTEGDSLPQQGPPTTSGLKYALFDKSFGITFNHMAPALFAELGLSLVELSIRLKCSIQYGFTGALLSLGVNWSNETTEVASGLILSPAAVILNLDFAYLEQRLTLPIVLSTEFSPFLMLGAVVLPSSAAVLGYRFVVIPRRRARRREYLRTLKKDVDENSDLQKQRNTVELLRDSVKKQIRLETEREGLIIQEAKYGATAETDDATENMSLDVTIPLQALVRNSQLHIPGGDTKAALQGFSDPAPFTPKTLHIRYLFHGRLHYAEIPDYLPVVLPLAASSEFGVDKHLSMPYHVGSITKAELPAETQSH